MVEVRSYEIGNLILRYFLFWVNSHLSHCFSSHVIAYIVSQFDPGIFLCFQF